MLTLVGDPHAKPDNLDKINTLFDMVEDLGNATVWLGDLLDTKELVRGKCLNTYLRRFKESKLNHTVLVGNHDLFRLDDTEHSLEALKALPNVTIVDKPYRHGSMLCLPYTHDPEQLKAWIKDHGDDFVTLFCHADIRNFDYGNGRISEEGMSVEDFEGLKRVISGHYHCFSERGNITYLGTPFSHSFGESNQDKFLGIYETSTDTLELIPTPFPRHITLNLSADEYGGADTNDVDIYRIILTGTQEQINKFNKRDGVKYIEMPSNVVEDAAVSELDSPEQQFAKWATEIKGYSKEILDLGMEMLADV